MTPSHAAFAISGGSGERPAVAGEGLFQQAVGGEGVEGIGRDAGGRADEPVVGDVPGDVADGGELAAAQEGLAGFVLVDEAWGFLDGLQTAPAFPREWEGRG